MFDLTGDEVQAIVQAAAIAAITFPDGDVVAKAAVAFHLMIPDDSNLRNAVVAAGGQLPPPGRDLDETEAEVVALLALSTMATIGRLFPLDVQRDVAAGLCKLHNQYCDDPTCPVGQSGAAMVAARDAALREVD